MKICITAAGSGTKIRLDPRFGRCAYFAIADLETDKKDLIENPSASSGGGAGVAAGQLMADKDVSAVITGNVGPNAMNVLKAAGIEIYRGVDGTVDENIELYKSKVLQKIETMVPPHSGMGRKGGRG